MRLLLILPAVLLPAASAAAPASEPAAAAQTAPAVPTRVIDPNEGQRSGCPPVSRYHAMKEGERLGLKRLDELPDADHYKAAYRKIDGCEAPIVANFGVTRR